MFTADGAYQVFATSEFSNCKIIDPNPKVEDTKFNLNTFAECIRLSY